MPQPFVLKLSKRIYVCIYTSENPYICRAALLQCYCRVLHDRSTHHQGGLLVVTFEKNANQARGGAALNPSRPPALVRLGWVGSCCAQVGQVSKKGERKEKRPCSNADAGMSGKMGASRLLRFALRQVLCACGWGL